jgi:hypothetical protein
VKDKLEESWKEWAVAYFKVILCLEGMRKNHNNCQSVQPLFRPRFQPGHKSAVMLPCELLKHYAMKAYGGVEVQMHSCSPRRLQLDVQNTRTESRSGKATGTA